MGLQATRLTMIGLGVESDAPPDPIQPKLADGVHLRWQFQRELGFPWYGFFLFRRAHAEGKRVCLSEVFRLPAALQSGALSALSTPLGEVSSDRPLRFSDDFAPAGVPEIELDGRSYVRVALSAAAVARRVFCTIGFRGDEGERRHCLRFLDRKPDHQSNPRRENDIEFEVREAGGVPAPNTRVVLVTTTQGRWSGLDCGSELTITLPAPVDGVDLLVTQFSKPAIIEAQDSRGARVALVAMRNPSREPEHVSLRGRDIRRVVIHARQNETVLHEICTVVRGARHAGKAAVRVRAYQSSVRVADATAVGSPGDVVTVELHADAIDRVDIERGSAVLIDLCVVPVAQGAADGWQPLRDFPYAMSLPVTHPDYPASNYQPVDEAAAEAIAMGRIRYGGPAPWAGAPFADLHDELVRLVAGGPAGAPMVDRFTPAVAGVAVPPDAAHQAPTLAQRRALDAVLLGALNPALAQMLGLFWVDASATPGAHYDYLIVADQTGVGGRNPQRMLAEIHANGFARLDGYIVFDKVVAPAIPPGEPAGLRSYALPGSTRTLADGSLDPNPNNAGLRWTLPAPGTGQLQAGSAVLYHVWRAGLGNGNAPAAGGAFALLTADAPVLVVESILSPGEEPQRAEDWPPFPLHYLDQGLAEGWYAYRVSGLDLFGRLSAQSDPATWFEWAPAPDPRPWYYADPPGDYAIHPSAIRLLDKLPPPPPTAVEAFALDPQDPYLLRDAAYNGWFATLSQEEQGSVVGLRVRWQWTYGDMQQAPDTQEFRIYYQGGRLNALVGRITAVALVSSVESDVTTDIPNAQAAGAYTSAHLRIGTDAYQITGSNAGTPLTVRVRHLGVTEDAGTVAVNTGSATVAGAGTAWHVGLIGMKFQVTGDATTYQVHAVTSATQLTLASVYSGANAAVAAYSIFDRRPAALDDCTVAIPPAYAAGSVAVTHGDATVTGAGTQWTGALVGQLVRIQGDSSAYRVAGVTSNTQLSLDKVFAGLTASSQAYAITFPMFTDFRLPTNWEQRFYVVDYTDYVTVTVDSNGNPLRKYEVFLPAYQDAERGGAPLATTLAQPVAYAFATVTAADDKVHTADAPKWAGQTWGDRTGNESFTGPAAGIFRVRRASPEAPEPPADSERVFATAADYNSKSYYTYRWRARQYLKTHVYRALDDALFKADWARRATAHAALDGTELELFPSEATEPRWDLAKRQQVAAELNQLDAIAHDPAGTLLAAAAYRALSNDGLRVLASLPGTERAFEQLTSGPLDPDDVANADRRGPDSAAGYAPDGALRAYGDVLDGRSTNRYFYRSAYVDSANNRSAYSRSSPPVWLPNVVPPRAPVITKVLGGERAITLSWASNRERDLAEYRIYRAASADDTRDLRLMTLVRVEPVGVADPAARPAQVSWTDAVPGLVTFFYRLVAVDDADNVSAPSTMFAGRGFDESLPVPPALAAVWAVRNGTTHAEISWNSADEVLIQRRDTGAASWVDLTQWRASGANEIRDPYSDPTKSYDYRARCRKATGAVAFGPPVTLEPE